MRQDLFPKVRCLALIGISINLAGNVQLESVRIFGILQRLAVSYFFVSISTVLIAKAMSKGEERAWPKVTFQAFNLENCNL
jgi:hypothetical protein